MENWVDFKTIKQTVTLEQVLGRYGIKLKRTGKELRGRCPIHQGEGTDSFHANTEKNAFHCFSCQAKGNVLDFVAAMEKCSIRDAGLKLKDWFGVAAVTGGSSLVTEQKKTTGSELAREEIAGEPEPAAVNVPLKFQLKGIDHGHAYLTGRGITKETAERFGVGFFPGKGSMSGRVVIPIHNERGELVAYAGRSIDGAEPRYKLPAGFHKAAEIFNLHRLVAGQGADELVVVEGFFDCMKVSQVGFPCVALMGSSLSAQQEELLCRYCKVAVLMFDGDEAGSRATDDCLVRLGRRGLWVKAVVLQPGQQPDQLSTEELAGLLRK
jgi:DNA primase